MRLYLSIIAAVLLGLSAPVSASAQAPAEQESGAERLPIDLRRTTLLVRDMEVSLTLYRDALGMAVIYDQHIPNPSGGDPSRLVLLKANNETIGVIGLWQLASAPDAPAKPPHDGLTPGDTILLFNTSELDSVYPAATAVEGVEVLFEPAFREYPGDGVTYRVMVSMIRDPDGYLVELNNRLSPPIEWD